MALYFGEVIHKGWSLRIQNRMLSRYVSTYHFREKKNPSYENLHQKFFIHPDHEISIPNPDTTVLKFTLFGRQKEITLQHSFFLWRPKYGFFSQNTFDSHPTKTP